MNPKRFPNEGDFLLIPKSFPSDSKHVSNWFPSDVTLEATHIIIMIGAYLKHVM